jgi:anti-sigma B factor antagonist
MTATPPYSETSMNIDFDHASGVTLVRLLDRRLDAAGASDFKERVGDCIEEGARHVVLDLAAVDFVDSTGLSAILSVLKRLSPEGGLALAGCRPAVVELMKLTRLDRVLRLFPTSESATAALAAA